MYTIFKYRRTEYLIGREILSRSCVLFVRAYHTT
jgi:hypothetical protein